MCIHLKQLIVIVNIVRRCDCRWWNKKLSYLLTFICWATNINYLYLVLTYLLLKSQFLIGRYMQQSISIWLWSRDCSRVGWCYYQNYGQLKFPKNCQSPRCVTSDVTARRWPNKWQCGRLLINNDIYVYIFFLNLLFLFYLFSSPNSRTIKIRY